MEVDHINESDNGQATVTRKKSESLVQMDNSNSCDSEPNLKNGPVLSPGDHSSQGPDDDTSVISEEESRTSFVSSKSDSRLEKDGDISVNNDSQDKRLDSEGSGPSRSMSPSGYGDRKKDGNKSSRQKGISEKPFSEEDCDSTNEKADDTAKNCSSPEGPGLVIDKVMSIKDDEKDCSSEISEIVIDSVMSIKNEAHEFTEDDKTTMSKIDDECGLPGCFKDSVSIGEYIPITMPKTGEFKMAETEALLEAPSLTVPLLIKKSDKFPPREKPLEPKKDIKGSSNVNNYFGSTVGEFLIGIGLSRVFEVFNKDMMKYKEKEIKKHGKLADLLEDQQKFRDSYNKARTANEPFKFPAKQCRACDFKTESQLVLEGHYLTPHFTSRRELRCSFCNFITRDAKAIIFHLEAIHNKVPVMEPPPQFYECPFCTFDTNLKTKASAHVNRCQKFFSSSLNQAAPTDFSLPAVTNKPITVNDIKTYEKFFTALSAPKQSRPTNESLLAANAAGMQARNGTTAMRPNLTNTPLYHQLASTTSVAQNRARMRTPTRLALLQPQQNPVFQVMGGASEMIPLLSNGNSQLTVTLSSRPSPPVVLPNAGRPSGPSLGQRSSVPSGQSPAPRPAAPSGRSPVILESSNSSAAFVICEICDGYIKDLEQLRTHMQWIHKVKIHPKMLASRPPLNCQKCQWRFFTDQGLERHLLGAHGLVTSNMQELANTGQDGGRCTVCGRIYASKLVAHMSQVHRVVLKPAHLSYKCTVCSATFNLYKLFETHVYTVHSGAMKRSSSADNSSKAKKVATEQAGKPVPATQNSKAPTPPPKLVLIDTPALTPPKPATNSDTTDVPTPTQELQKNEEGGEVVNDDDNSDDDIEEIHKCKECGVEISDVYSHVKDNHIKRCGVKLCRIEKCEKCLCSFDGMIVLHTADFGMDEEDDEEDEEEDDNDGEDKKVKEADEKMEVDTNQEQEVDVKKATEENEEKPEEKQEKPEEKQEKSEEKPKLEPSEENSVSSENDKINDEKSCSEKKDVNSDLTEEDSEVQVSTEPCEEKEVKNSVEPEQTE